MARTLPSKLVNLTKLLIKNKLKAGFPCLLDKELPETLQHRHVLETPRWRRIATQLSLAVAVSVCGTAQAIPVEVTWQLPLNDEAIYALEVAVDPGFANVVLRRDISGSGFSWDAPGEGIYHWRLTRPMARARADVETSNFASGSFVAVHGSATRERSARISWQTVPAADRYKIIMIERDGPTRTLVSQATSFALPQTAVDMMIEVIPFTGNSRTFRDFHFNRSLTFDPGRSQGAAMPQAEAAAVAAQVATSSVPAKARTFDSPAVQAKTTGVRSGGASGEQDLVEVSHAPARASTTQARPGVVSSPGAVGAKRVSSTPPPKPSQVAADAAVSSAAKAASTTEPPPPAVVKTEAEVAASEPPRAPAAAPADVRRRRHMIYSYSHFDYETLEFRKLEKVAESKKGALGVGAGLWLNPVSGLVVSAQASYHEHAAPVRSESHFPGKSTMLTEARFTADFAVGLDVLGLFGSQEHALVVSVLGAASQLPAFPTQNPASGPALAVETRSLSLGGGSLSYGFLTDSVGVMVEGGYAADQNADATLAFGRAMVDLYATDHLAILVGAYGRSLDSSQCDSKREVCLSDGKSVSLSTELGGFIGIGAVLR